MRTKDISALVTLSAGAVYCVIALYYHTDSGTFVKQLLLVLILFFVIGCIAQEVADRFFPIKKEEEAEGSQEEQPENAEGAEHAADAVNAESGENV